MNKQIITLAAGLIIAASSCTKKGSSSTTSTSTGTTTTTTPTDSSTFDITFNGYTYHKSSIIGKTVTTIVCSTEMNPPYGYGYVSTTDIKYAAFGVKAGLVSNDLNVTLVGQKLDASTATGTYRVGVTDNYYYGTQLITHFVEGGKQYGSDLSGKDTTGVINVTVSNATEVKGTFSITLSYNGNYYPSTGSFHYKK